MVGMSYFRIQEPHRDVDDLLVDELQTSTSWTASEQTRCGVSVCCSRPDLARYLAHAGIPFESTWVLVELDGASSPYRDEDAGAPGRPRLIYPRRIIAVTPIAEDFEWEILAAYDAGELTCSV